MLQQVDSSLSTNKPGAQQVKPTAIMANIIT